MTLLMITVLMISAQNDSAQNDTRSRPISPFHSWLPSPPPADQNIGHIAESSRATLVPQTLIFNVTMEQRTWLESQLAEFRDIIPGFYLPSQHSLTRYLTSFAEGFHSHLPHVHFPTTRIEDLSPDAIIAFAATGAQYVFEHRNADRLFYAGKAILIERLRRQREEKLSYTDTSRRAMGARRLSRVSAILSPDEINSHQTQRDCWALHQSLSAAVTLMGYGAWEGVILLRESLRLASVVVECLRDCEMSNTAEEVLVHQTWKEWARAESQRRTQLVAFTFLETLCIAYNVAPYVFNSQISYSSSVHHRGMEGRHRGGVENCARRYCLGANALSRGPRSTV